MSEPTTEEMVVWLDCEATESMYCSDREMACAIADRLRATQWRKVTEDEPAPPEGEKP